MWSLTHPQALFGLFAVPLLAVVFALDGLRRRRLLERIGHLPQIERLTANVSRARRRWKALLFTTAVGLLVLALAGPEGTGQARLAPRRGLDLVVALDFSRSMLATDAYPSRSERAKRELDRLVDGLRGDRLGMVAFAGVTLSYPLTTDYAAAKLFFRDLTPDDIPVGGTNLGGAIRAALELLDHGQDRRPRPGVRPPAQVIILVTDGADTEGGAIAQAEEARRRGVLLFTVGIGTTAGEYVTLRRGSDGTAEYVSEDGNPVRMRLDVETLRRLAATTGGDYFAVDTSRFGVDEVQRAIAALERSEEEARVVREPEPLYWALLLPALLLLLLEGLLGDRRRRQRAPAPGALLTLLLVALAPGLLAFDWFERPDPEVERGNRLLGEGKAEAALAAYERALARQPDEPLLHYDRGAALHALGRYPEAQKEFERAAEGAEPSLKADALYNLGNSLLRQRRAKEALTAYKRALALRPDDRRTKWNLELALRQMQKQEQEQRSSQGSDKNDQSQASQDDKSKDQPTPPNSQPTEQSKPDGAKPGESAGQSAASAPRKPDSSDDQKPNDQSPKAGDKARDQAPKSQPSAQSKASQQSPTEREQPPQQSPQSREQPGQQIGQSGAGEAQQSGQSKEQAAQASGSPAAAAAPAREIDRQDAAAILEAFERVEPTVQKELARRRAGNRKPRRDY